MEKLFFWNKTVYGNLKFFAAEHFIQLILNLRPVETVQTASNFWYGKLRNIV